LTIIWGKHQRNQWQGNEKDDSQHYFHTIYTISIYRPDYEDEIPRNNPSTRSGCSCCNSYKLKVISYKLQAIITCYIQEAEKLTNWVSFSATIKN
jgi:hypothetical protein